MTDVIDDVGAPVSHQPIEEYLDFPGGRIHLLRGGQGAPLLLLHAAGGAGRWHEFHQLLARRFTVFAPDHPGFGGSDELPEVDGVDDLVYHYLDLIERLGLDGPHVVGLSFGGWIAAELAVAAPQAIGSLVLLAAAGLRLPEHPVADLFLMTPTQRANVLFHDPAKAAAFAPADPDLDAIIDAYRDLTALARFAWSPLLSNPKLERRLRRVTAPTQVVWAADDRLIPIAHGRRYAELIPHAEFAVIENCGHAAHFECPREAADLVTDFLVASAQRSGASR